MATVPVTPQQQHKQHGQGLACNGKRMFRMIPILVNSVNTPVFLLPQDNVLNNSRILAVEAFSLSDFATGPNGATPANATAFANAFLTLFDAVGNQEVISKIPLSRLRAAANAGEAFKTCIKQISSANCKIEVGAIGSLVAGETFFIGIHYEAAE